MSPYGITRPQWVNSNFDVKLSLSMLIFNYHFNWPHAESLSCTSCTARLLTKTISFCGVFGLLVFEPFVDLKASNFEIDNRRHVSDFYSVVISMVKFYIYCFSKWVKFMYKMWWQVTICCQNCKWQEHHLFHTQLWFPASDHDFWWFGSYFWSFCKAITEKNIVEEIELIMGACAKQSSPSRVCIPQKSGIATHSGDLHSTQAPMMDSLYLWLSNLCRGPFH